MVTDLGYITQLVAERLRRSDLVLIESNHDLDLLKIGPYPWSVKQRIASKLGHLSNEETARWIREDFDGQAAYLVLAHISRRCNHPELARLTALEALESRGSGFFSNPSERLKVAYPDTPTEWFNL
jgi:phosphoribosyl 1,2-cyclic phosphodiesterase